MNALYLLGFALVIGMMTCEGKPVADTPVAERSMWCLVDCTPYNPCHSSGKCHCYTRGDDDRNRCITKEEAEEIGITYAKK
uniref:Putative secreted protein n=1 Tax=Amblyomma cajennense TaxID=34607 RepID=A0A023FBB9_AMBCJ